jgi:hypothetical protein
MAIPIWTDDVELLRAPVPGDSGTIEPRNTRGQLGGMVRYVTEDLPTWLRPFHSLRLGDGKLISYDEIARLASLDTYRQWLVSNPQ